MFKGFFRLVRLFNLLIIALTQYALRYFVIGGITLPKLFVEPQIFLLSVITMLIASAGYIINDYYDIKIDMINKPVRVVIGRYLTRRKALILHLVLNTIAFIIAFLFLGWMVFFYVLFCSFLLWLYSNRLKRIALAGNMTVAVSSAAAVFIVYLPYRANLPAVLTFTYFAFCISLIREIVKDIEDMKGDRQFGCKTLPIVWGIRKTKELVFVVTIIFSVTTLWFSFSLKPHLFYYYSGFILLPAVGFLVLLYFADTRKKFAFLSSYCKFLMLLGIGGMVFI